MNREEEAFELSHPDKLPSDAWIVRSCEQFLEEVRECRRFRGRFHQYFLYGQLSDCSSWREDLFDCRNWRKTGELQYMDKLIAKERERYNSRMNAHDANDVWQRRSDGPPSDWMDPLPDLLEQKRQKSFLYSYVHGEKRQEKEDGR